MPHCRLVKKDLLDLCMAKDPIPLNDEDPIDLGGRINEYEKGVLGIKFNKEVVWSWDRIDLECHWVVH